MLNERRALFLRIVSVSVGAEHLNAKHDNVNKMISLLVEKLSSFVASLAIAIERNSFYSNEIKITVRELTVSFVSSYLLLTHTMRSFLHFFFFPFFFFLFSFISDRRL